LGDHSETVQIDFDPSRITYRDLLDAFSRQHDPTRRSWSRQYASLILYHSEQQRREAEAWKDEMELHHRRVATEIRPFESFTLAEGYHQKHSLQLFPEFFEEMHAFYPTMQAMIGSTAAARLNGYVAGDGNCASLDNELDSLGLSATLRERLREMVCGRKAGPGPACPVPTVR
jgi:hypothetical protein